MARVLQCVASRGVASSVWRTTSSTSASVIRRGAPGRGSSSSPSSRRVTNRARHLPTICLVTPKRVATVVLDTPVAHASTIRARNASACAVFGRRPPTARASRAPRLSPPTPPSAVRPPCRLLPIAGDERRPSVFSELRAQDTSPCVPRRSGRRRLGAGGGWLQARDFPGHRSPTASSLRYTEGGSRVEHRCMPSGRSMRRGRLLAATLLVLGLPWRGAAASFTTFESGPVRPLALTPDGARLLVAHP